jgi:hypothetical protein
MGSDALVTCVWHEQAAVQQARPEKLSRNLSEQQKVGADDGNRTRMTSLEERYAGLRGDQPLCPCS